MENKWYLNSGITQGRSHIKKNVPCQDSVKTIDENGVAVVAVSDGCGSSYLSQYGSDITTNVLCSLLTNQFDFLYSKNEAIVKRKIINAIIHELKVFISKNGEMVDDYISKHLDEYNAYVQRTNKEIADDYYKLTIFNATVKFVAVKENKIIMGSLGDGIVTSIINKKLKINLSEDKIGVADNVTNYPPSIYFYDKYTTIKDSYDLFKIYKADNADEYDGFLVSTDGTEPLLIQDFRTEKYLDINKTKQLYEEKDLTNILETVYKPVKGLFDDLSVGIMRRESIEIDGVISREYDENGATIKNEKVISKEEAYSDPITEIKNDTVKNEVNETSKIVKEDKEKTLSEIFDDEINLQTDFVNEAVNVTLVNEDFKKEFIELYSEELYEKVNFYMVHEGETLNLFLETSIKIKKFLNESKKKEMLISDISKLTKVDELDVSVQFKFYWDLLKMDIDVVENKIVCRG